MVTVHPPRSVEYLLPDADGARRQVISALEAKGVNRLTKSTILHNSAGFFQKIGNPLEAWELIARSIQLKEDLFPPEHHSILSLQLLEASILLDLNKTRIAKDVLMHALLPARPVHRWGLTPEDSLTTRTTYTRNRHAPSLP